MHDQAPTAVAPADALLGTTLGEGYQIIRHLRPGNDEVAVQLYEAIQAQTQRHAIIKILPEGLAEDREAAARFANEGHIATLISHPGIVRIYATGQLASGAPYLILEYLSGELLRDRLRGLGGRMAPQKAMRLARKVAAVLVAVHEKQVVHRDLKPANLMLIPDADTPDGEQVKLLSFGIARLVVNSEAFTQHGVSMGTPTYMSPEQCENASEVSDRSDIYSLGIVLYEMLVGAPPFSDAQGSVAVMTAQLHKDPPPLANRAPDAAPELCVLVHRMLAKSPAARPGAAEVATILSELLGSKRHASSASPPVPQTPPSLPAISTFSPLPQAEVAPAGAAQRTSQGRLIAIVATLLLGLGLGGLGFAVTARRRAAPPLPITWAVTSQPTAAEVTDATGQVLGPTPWQQVQPRGSGLVTVTIRKKSYREETVVLDRAHDEQRSVVLTLLPVEAPTPAATPVPVVPPVPPPIVPAEQPRKLHHKPAHRRHGKR